jgi:hypothetical protein
MVTAVRVARPSLIDQGLDRPGVADIDHRGRSGTGSVPGQFTSGAFGAVTVDVGHHHRVAPGDQRAGQGSPDARGGPGNDCYPRHPDLRSRPVPARGGRRQQFIVPMAARRCAPAPDRRSRTAANRNQGRPSRRPIPRSGLASHLIHPARPGPAGNSTNDGAMTGGRTPLALGDQARLEQPCSVLSHPGPAGFLRPGHEASVSAEMTLARWFPGAGHGPATSGCHVVPCYTYLRVAVELSEVNCRG